MIDYALKGLLTFALLTYLFMVIPMSGIGILMGLVPGRNCYRTNNAKLGEEPDKVPFLVDNWKNAL
jgi:hypothetical protein